MPVTPGIKRLVEKKLPAVYFTNMEHLGIVVNRIGLVRILWSGRMLAIEVFNEPLIYSTLAMGYMNVYGEPHLSIAPSISSKVRVTARKAVRRVRLNVPSEIYKRAIKTGLSSITLIQLRQQQPHIPNLKIIPDELIVLYIGDQADRTESNLVVTGMQQRGRYGAANGQPAAGKILLGQRGCKSHPINHHANPYLILLH